MSLIPGAIYDPGAHWNYQAGSFWPLMLVWHYTVGRDSRALIRDRGLACALIWDDVIWQYAPLDAVCFTQCEWNRRSVAYEVESLDGSITDGQIALLGYATTYALLTYGIPADFYDGPRLPIGYDFRGVTNHRDLIHVACDMHSDGFDRWVWDAAMAPPPAPKRKRARMISFLVHELFSDSIWQVNPDTATKVHIKTPEQYVAQVRLRQLANYVAGEKVADDELHRTDELDGLWRQLWDEARDVDEFNDTGSGGTGGGGATEQQVRDIVVADGNQTRAAVAAKRPITGTVG